MAPEHNKPYESRPPKNLVYSIHFIQYIAQ